MTSFFVQPFQETESEYEELASLLRVASPRSRPESASELRQEDLEWPSDSLFGRVVLTDPNQRWVGVGTCYQAYWQDAPFTVHFHFDIDPEFEQEQVLSLLFARLQGLVTDSGTIVKRFASRARENETVRVQFLLDRGFQEVMRFPTSVLRANESRGDYSEGAGEHAVRNGVRIMSLAQLKAEDPDWKRRLHDIRCKLVQDVDSVEPISKPTIAEFEEMVLNDPALEEDAFFVALNPAGELIGMSNLWRNDPTGQRLDTGLTGVVESYRRQGIATALKMRTIQYALSSGAATIETSNEEGSAMYALNLKLGFQPGPAWLKFTKESTFERSDAV